MFGRRSVGAAAERLPSVIPARPPAAVLPVHDDSSLRPKVEAPRRPEPAAGPMAFSRVAVPAKVVVAADDDNRIDVSLTRADVAKFGVFDD